MNKQPASRHLNHQSPRRKSLVASLVAGGAIPLVAPTTVDRHLMSWFGSTTTKADRDEDYDHIDHVEKDTTTSTTASASTPDSSTTSKEKTVSMMRLLSYSTKKERWLMGFGLLLATVSGLGIPTWLVLLARSLDTFSNMAYLSSISANVSDALMDELMELVVAFFVVGVIVLFTGGLYVSIWTYTGEQQSLRIQSEFVFALLKQDAAFFDLRNREELPTVLDTSMFHVKQAIGRTIADTYCHMISSLGCLTVALLLNAPLALVMLCVVPIVLLIMWLMGRCVRRSSQDSQDQSAKAGALATEVLAGIKTVTALCAQQWVLLRYKQHSESSQSQAVRSGFLSSLMAGSMGFLFYATYTMAFMIGTVQVADDATATSILKCLFSSDPNCRVTGASVMTCIYGVILSVTFVGLLTPGMRNLNLGRQAAVEIFSTIKRKPPIDSSLTGGLKLESMKGLLQFRDITFAYPSRPVPPLFFQLNLTIQPGTSVALVGPSGSGKSTLARLLLRLYDPSCGNVLVDGVSLRDLNLNWWRSQIGYVAQEPTLFPGTIAFNIAVGKPGGASAATQEEIEAAAKAACAHEFIMDLPLGYETFYAGASLQLSGGQVQRLSLARAMIRKPSILLLDEATSALDNTSEHQVQQALENIRKVQKVTTVSVSHRLSTIINCDQIAVIADGQIKELGTHAELIAKVGGVYAGLCKSQGMTTTTTSMTKSTTTDATTDTTNPAASATAAETTTATTSMLLKGQSSSDGAIIDSKNHLPAKQEVAALKEADDVVTTDDADSDLKEVELADLSRLKKYRWSKIWYTVLGFLGSVMIGALSPSESILTAQIVVTFYDTPADEMVDVNRKWILYFLAFAGVSLIGNVMFGVGFSVSGYSLATVLKVETFQSMIRRDMSWFDMPEHSTGELTKLLSADVEAVADNFGWQWGFKIRMLSSILTGIVIALVYSWQIGLVALCCVPLILGAALVQVLCLRKQFVRESDGLPPSTILEQALRGISAIQAYGLEADVGANYVEALEPERAAKVKQGVIAGAVYGFSQFSVFASFAIVFLVGSKLLVDVAITFVEFFTPVLAVMFGALGAAQVSAEFQSEQMAKAAAARILKVLDEEPLDRTDPFSTSGEKPTSFQGSISFDSCYFHYPTRPEFPIFYKSDTANGLSLDIAAKETVAFVGKSGCGKSTVLQLVLRFYECSNSGNNSLLVDGKSIEDINIGYLRRHIGYVGQQPVLFSGTVRENILLGNPDATEEEIIAAAKAANAHGFISNLDKGYDSDIGAGGSRLSGGMRQRLCICRAIVASPQILVLDEATSALDNESQREVQKALEQLQQLQPRTTLTVAHRLTTIQTSDQIVVLGHGGVQEMGKHEQLLAQKGLYYELWQMQGDNSNGGGSA